MKRVRVKQLSEFQKWLLGLSNKTHLQIDNRIRNIELYDHFGETRHLGDGIFELKWKSGLRVYCGSVSDAEGRLVLVILGGNKNGQSKDIHKAKVLYRRYSGEET